MRLPRWLVICLLGTSVLATIGAAGWWWVTWPQRTARTFVQLLVDCNWTDAKAMSSKSNEPLLFFVFDEERLRSAWSESSLEFEPRGMSDLIECRQNFRVGRKPWKADGEGELHFVRFSARRDSVERPRRGIETDLNWDQP